MFKSKRNSVKKEMQPCSCCSIKTDALKIKKCCDCANPVCKKCFTSDQCHICKIKMSPLTNSEVALKKIKKEKLVQILKTLHFDKTKYKNITTEEMVKQIMNRTTNNKNQTTNNQEIREGTINDQNQSPIKQEKEDDRQVTESNGQSETKHLSEEEETVEWVSSLKETEPETSELQHRDETKVEEEEEEPEDAEESAVVLEEILSEDHIRSLSESQLKSLLQRHGKYEDVLVGDAEFVEEVIKLWKESRKANAELNGDDEIKSDNDQDGQHMHGQDDEETEINSDNDQDGQQTHGQDDEEEPLQASEEIEETLHDENDQCEPIHSTEDDDSKMHNDTPNDQTEDEERDIELHDNLPRPDEDSPTAANRESPTPDDVFENDHEISETTSARDERDEETEVLQDDSYHTDINENGRDQSSNDPEVQTVYDPAPEEEIRPAIPQLESFEIEKEGDNYYGPMSARMQNISLRKPPPLDTSLPFEIRILDENFLGGPEELPSMTKYLKSLEESQVELMEEFLLRAILRSYSDCPKGLWRREELVKEVKRKLRQVKEEDRERKLSYQEQLESKRSSISSNQGSVKSRRQSLLSPLLDIPLEDIKTEKELQHLTTRQLMSILEVRGMSVNWLQPRVQLLREVKKLWEKERALAELETVEEDVDRPMHLQDFQTEEDLRNLNINEMKAILQQNGQSCNREEKAELFIRLKKLWREQQANM